MTLAFVPGEVNAHPYSLAQTVWKNHHIVVYCSGNNLVISTTSTPKKFGQRVHSKRQKNLQTVYLDRDAIAVDINSKNAFVSVSIGEQIHIFRPDSEYSQKPHWSQSHIFSADGVVNCLQWADSNDELVVATNDSLVLYHVYDEYGETVATTRWSSPQPNSITHVRITRNGSKIITRDNYDRLAKLWTRASYGDTTSLFVLTYVEHPQSTFVVDFRWKCTETHTHGMDLTSMANIKNMRGFLENDSDNDILYTLTNDGILRAWSTDTSGHNRIRLCGELNIRQNLSSENLLFSSLIIIDNCHLHKYVNDNLLSKINRANVEGLELVLATSTSGQVFIYSIDTSSPGRPNSIQFLRLNTSQPVFFNDHCYPLGNLPEEMPQELTEQSIQSVDFISKFVTPIIIPDIQCVEFEESLGTPQLSILVHDRIKHTIRVDYLDLEAFSRAIDTSSRLGTKLMDKFSGHTKAIHRLRKSTSSKRHNTVLISISDFPDQNYIWEPLILNEGTNRSMTLAKRFRIEVPSSEEGVSNHSIEGIWDAVIINDIELFSDDFPPSCRHHLVPVIEKNGYISLWDCNGTVMDDQPAHLLTRSRIEDNHGHYLRQRPKAFVLSEIETTPQKRSYCAIAIFERDLIRAWKVSIEYVDQKVEKIEMTSFAISTLPQEEEIHAIEMVDSYASEKNVITVIDVAGILRIFAVSFKDDTCEWVETKLIHTNIKNASRLHGATIINKMAIVDESGLNMSIWDTKSGVLEYEETFEETVLDIDWTKVDGKDLSSTSSFAILSVGFARHVLLFTQLRYDYTNKMPTFGVIKKLDISDYTAHEIGDSIWVNNSYLVIASGNQFFIDDRWIQVGTSSNRFIDSTIRQLVGENSNEESIEITISNLVRILNGPLPVYHPQFLIQSLFWNKIQLVKDILVRLLKVIRLGGVIEWDLEMNLGNVVLESPHLDGSVADSGVQTPQSNGGTGRASSSTLFEDNAFNSTIQTFFEFNSELATALTEKLTKISLPFITRHQQITLLSVISIVSEIDKYSATLDGNGIRFLIGFKLFQMSSKQTHLTMRDINWALHSDNKEVIMSIVEEHYKLRIEWRSVRESGLAYWVDEPSKLANYVEKCARNEFANTRDPSGLISIFYLALRKKNVLIGLWKSVTHQDQQKMLKFLNNDFTEKRWRTAALKNAFVLMSKHRYLDAASFFLLADSLKDCCNVLANKVNDMNLVLAVTKVYEYSKTKSTPDTTISNMAYILESFILPDALQKGDRWTTSWILWEMKKNELAIKALIESPIAVVKQNRTVFSESCIKNNIEDVKLHASSKLFLKDDPVLMILFNNLRQRNVKFLHGALQVSPIEEYNFVVKVCLIYTRMGCDYLALSVLRNWVFVQYDTKEKDTVRWSMKDNIQDESRDTNVPSVLATGYTDGGRANGFGTDSGVRTKAQQPPPAVVFEEPDMSSFDFGF
ncbi:regulator of V-ATPase in vacuolar membrane protein 1 [[Candida] anglica]|uniref:Regulator of V-ATPase in vacuolar membrane protein 1 n=1 Tax=[Candida] anglica TaxID=148631 RepID=A0ABP0EF70_9ASCO